jgi:hypothetical protein
MASFRIWSRITPIPGSDRQLCIVVAVAEDTGQDDEAESRVVESRPLAERTCMSLVDAMVARIHGRGDVVRQVG